jgi:hypothetical protein
MGGGEGGGIRPAELTKQPRSEEVSSVLGDMPWGEVEVKQGGCEDFADAMLNLVSSHRKGAVLELPKEIVLGRGLGTIVHSTVTHNQSRGLEIKEIGAVAGYDPKEKKWVFVWRSSEHDRFAPLGIIPVFLKDKIGNLMLPVHIHSLGYVAPEFSGLDRLSIWMQQKLGVPYTYIVTSKGGGFKCRVLVGGVEYAGDIREPLRVVRKRTFREKVRRNVGF